MNEKSLDQLIRSRNSAKVKLILGIVFIAVGFFLSLLAILVSLVELLLLAWMMVFVVFALNGVGFPFFIIGLINTIKLGRAISLAQREKSTVTERPAEVRRPVAPSNPVVEQARPVAQNGYPMAQRGANVGGAAYLDWQKYAPLNAGVSYNANKNYNFHRADGFVGSMPQKFVDRTFPKCPICCSNEPYWTISQHNQMSWKGNLYLFKCSCCESIISMSMPDVTTLGNGYGGVAANPNVGLTNLMVKASSGKEAGAVYAVIETVGISGVDRNCEGKEFKLEHLQDMYLRN